MIDVEIICIGNELLIGKTLNTNENWLAKRITSMGLNVSRITTVGDELNAIKNAVKEALSRAPKLVITTGGLGPTYDDKTIEGVAISLNKPLKVDDKALQMVKTKYDAYSKIRGTSKIELTPARIKMATIPKDSNPLQNKVGTAPGVYIKINETYLILLPGVPCEMKSIFDNSVAPLLKREAGETKFYESSIEVEGIMESSLAPIIEKASRGNPYVYIKSHPKGEEEIPLVEIHFSTMGEDPEIAAKRLEEAKKDLLDLISGLEIR